MFALESLFKQEKADPHVLLPMSCVLDCVVPAFSRGVLPLPITKNCCTALGQLVQLQYRVETPQILGVCISQ